jgi:hypothetical protein
VKLSVEPRAELADSGQFWPDFIRKRAHAQSSRGAALNAFKHGRYTAEAIARRREISALLRVMRALAASKGRSGLVGNLWRLRNSDGE